MLAAIYARMVQAGIHHDEQVAYLKYFHLYMEEKDKPVHTD